MELFDRFIKWIKVKARLPNEVPLSSFDFNANLKLTQQYCDAALMNNNQEIASKFRTINPIYGKEPIFKIKESYHSFGEAAYYYASCEWTKDIFENKDLINILFTEQLLQKKNFAATNISKADFQGKILIADFDDNVMDGASEAESSGLFDIYDLPPIDTWFYMDTNERSGRRIFAWIPEPFVKLADEAIAVNCVDCIAWYS